jgi:N-formylglutamate deformylase
VVLDYPFDGTFVPDRFYRQNKSVLALMIEINRSLYMNEMSGKKLPGFPQIQETFSDILSEIVTFLKLEGGKY